MPERHSKLHILILSLGCLQSFGCARGISADPEVKNSQLEIRPLPGMSNFLVAPTDDDLISVYQCEFTAHHLDVLEFKLCEIKDHKLNELGKVAVSTLLPKSKGTLYIAFASSGGDSGTLSRILSLGISADNIRRYARISDFKIDPQYTFKSSTEIAKDFVVSANEEQPIWGCYWKVSDKNDTRPKTVQELLADKGPFESNNPQKIIDAAKAMDDVTVVLATVVGKE